MRLLPAAALFAGALLVAGAACGSGVEDEQPIGGADPDRGAIAAALSVVPATPGASDSVLVNDLAAAAEAAGVTAPDAGADEDELVDYFRALSGTEGGADVAVAPSQLVQTSPIDDADWRAEVGFAPVDVTGDVSAGLPPEQVQAVFGDFDEGAVDDAVRSDPTWSDQLDEVTYGDRTFYSWGEDGAIDPQGVSTVRRLGESTRLFVDGEAGIAYWTRTTEAMEQALDTLAGNAPSLADDPELGPLADALDARDAYSAIFTTDTDLFAGDGELEPYEAVATGAAVVDGQAQLLLVYTHADEASAQANADALATLVAEGESSRNGRPWSDVLGAGDVEVDGSLLIAAFPTEEPALWNEVMLGRDSLLTTG